MKKIKSLILVAAMFAATLSAFGQAQNIVDAALNGSTTTNGANYSLPAVTNLFHGTNGTSIFSFPFSKEVSIQISGVCSNTNAWTNVFTLDISDNNTGWATNAIALNITNNANSTNFIMILPTTNIGGLFSIRPGEFRWTNTTAYYSNLLFLVNRKAGF